jgi:orotidine-5'-phosphate decarboxylase
MPTSASPPAQVRDRLAIALDFDDPVVAMRWATRMKPTFGVAKIGLELWSASGPSLVAELAGEGYRVFVDLKLADIPNTTYRAARVLGSLGASYLTVHAFAGLACLRAGAQGFAEGAQRGGFPAPNVLAVTVLTSEPHAPSEVVAERARLASEAGCGGFVCAASDVAVAKQAAPGLMAVVPGVRFAGTGADDQGRPSTPGAAVAAGADLLVVGRAVTAADDPAGAAAALVAEVMGSLG